MKNLCLHNVEILDKFLKDQALNKKYIAEKDDIIVAYFMQFDFRKAFDLLTHTKNKKRCVAYFLLLVLNKGNKINNNMLKICFPSGPQFNYFKLNPNHLWFFVD